MNWLLHFASGDDPMTHIKPISIAVCSILATAFAGSALAANSWPSYDRKTYTGAQCQPATGSQGADFNIFAGQLRNISGGLRWASCAITFDQEGSVSSTDVDTATEAGAIEIRAYLDYSAVAAGTDHTTNCTIRSVEPFGTSKVVADSVTSAKTTNAVNVTFTPAELASLDGIHIGSQVSLQLSCRLPPLAAIEVVKIYENGGTGNYRWVP